MRKRWLEIIRHPTRAVIVGASGSGKSATAHWLAELLAIAEHLPVYVYGVEPQRQRLYPPRLKHVDQGEDMPEDAVLIIDEAALEMPARRSMRTENVELAQLAYKARHKRLTILAVTQAGSELDKILIDSAEIIIVKRPRLHQEETDRPHLRPLLEEANVAFDGLGKSEDPRSWAYVEHRGGRELLRTELASWWTEDLSNSMANLPPERLHPRRLPKEERKRLAREMRGRGYTYAQIGERLKMPKSTTWYFVNGYPTPPSKRRERERDVDRVGGASLTLSFPRRTQRSLMQLAELRSGTWIVPLLRAARGNVILGKMIAKDEGFLALEGPEVVGFATPHRWGPGEIQGWLQHCARGGLWPGVKLNVIAMPRVLEVRTWPEGAQWHAEAFARADGTESRLLAVYQHRPVLEIVAPTTLEISRDGSMMEPPGEEDKRSPHRVRSDRDPVLAVNRAIDEFVKGQGLPHGGHRTTREERVVAINGAIDRIVRQPTVPKPSGRDGAAKQEGQ
ncbi:MAG: ATP-binding protein [Candidatus Methylomirabilales bacterium]